MPPLWRHLTATFHSRSTMKASLFTRSSASPDRTIPNGVFRQGPTRHLYEDCHIPGMALRLRGIPQSYHDL